MKITWDEPKRIANLAKHGLDFASVTPAIFASGVVQAAHDGRLKAIGFIDGVAVAMIFRPLGSQGLSVISLRPASHKERRTL